MHTTSLSSLCHPRKGRRLEPGVGRGGEEQHTKEEVISSEAYMSCAPECVGPQVLLSSDEALSQVKESRNASKNPSALAVGSLSGFPLRGKNLIISVQLLEKMEPESGKRIPTDSYGV